MTKTQKKDRNLYAILVLIFVLIALISFSFKNIKVGSKNYSKDSIKFSKLFYEDDYSRLLFNFNQVNQKVKVKDKKFDGFKKDLSKRESLLLKMADSLFTIKKKVKKEKIKVKSDEATTKKQILQNPKDIKLVYKYAREQFESGNVDEGIFAIKSLSKLYPNNITIKLDLLAIYNQAKLNEQALSLIEDIKKNSNSTEENIKFVSKIEQSINDNLNNKNLLSHMTNLFTHQTKSKPTLLSNMQEISKLSEDILKKRSIKNEYVAKKNVTWSQILQNPKDLKLNYQFARQQFKAGHINEGIASIKRMSKVYPDNIKIKLDLLNLYKNAGMRDEALLLINDIKQNNNTTDEQLSYVNQIETSFNFVHNEPEALPQKWMVSASLSYGYNQDNNVSGVTKKNLQVSSNEIVAFADPRFDNTTTKSVGLTAFKFFGEKSSIMMNVNSGQSDQDQGTGDYDNYGAVFSLDTYLGGLNLSPYFMLSKYENKYSAEMLSYLFGVNGSFTKGDRHKFSYGYSLGDTKYDQNTTYNSMGDYNSTTDSFSLGYDFYKSDKVSFTAGLSYSDSDVVVDAGNDYESYATDLRVNFSHPWAYFSFGDSITFTDYKDADTSLSGSQRSDAVNTLDFSISKALGDLVAFLDPNKNLVINLAFEKTFSESNIINYDYISDALSFSISKSINLRK